jgi:hypothetical protein
MKDLNPTQLNITYSHFAECCSGLWLFSQELITKLKRLLSYAIGKNRYRRLRDGVFRLLGKDVDWDEIPSAISLSRDIRVWGREQDLVRTDQVHALVLRAGLSDNMRMLLNDSDLTMCGGLEIWQLPEQIAPLLAHLAQPNQPVISSYLEIGVNRGGFFIFLTEWLRLINPKFQTAVGVDMKNSPSVVKYANENAHAHFIRSDSRSILPALSEMGMESVDLIYIDGDHSYDGVKSDYDLALQLNPKYILFHDIQDPGCPGVQQFWSEIRNENEAFQVHEFLSCDGPIQQAMGLGLLTRKSVSSLPGRLKSRNDKSYLRLSLRQE